MIAGGSSSTETGGAASLHVRLYRARPLAQLAVAALALILALTACSDGGGGPDMPIGAQIRVNSEADTADRDGVLTLREAIRLATGDLDLQELDETERTLVSGQPGPGSADLIIFTGPTSSGTPIRLASTLPPLSAGGDTIDGSTATGALIDGGDRSLVCLEITSSRNAVLGIQITGCHTAVLVREEAEGNRIGGAGEGEGNVLVGNIVGIELRGSRNTVQGNLVGVDATGQAGLGNEFEGIWITAGAAENFIGGPGEGQGNVISGNPLIGIAIDGSDNRVQGNLIGLSAAGTEAVPNKFGISVQGGATGNLIGGSKPTERNVISGQDTGVILRDAGTKDNTVRGNLFGTDVTGEIELRNGRDIWEIETQGENVVRDNRFGIGQ